MAVSGFARPHFEGQTGAFRLDRNETSLNYFVDVTDPLDCPWVVARAPGLPLLGSFYVVGNDVNPFLRCQEITPSRVPGNRLLWLVSCKYESPNFDQQQGKNEDGDPEDDPLKWRDEITVNMSQYALPVDIA